MHEWSMIFAHFLYGTREEEEEEAPPAYSSPLSSSSSEARKGRGRGRRRRERGESYLKQPTEPCTVGVVAAWKEGGGERGKEKNFSEQPRSTVICQMHPLTPVRSLPSLSVYFREIAVSLRAISGRGETRSPHKKRKKSLFYFGGNRAGAFWVFVRCCSASPFCMHANMIQPT